MRQNDALLPPANCTGMMGIDFSPMGSPVSPFLYDCDDWNTTAALSRQSAGMRIDTSDAWITERSGIRERRWLECDDQGRTQIKVTDAAKIEAVK